MKNFIFKSPETSKKLFQSIETIQKNVLYLTYRIDDMYKIVKRLDVNKDLQTQVDDYFDEGARVGLEDTRETSHQTESDEQ